MPEAFVLASGTADCRGQSHSELDFKRADKLTADSGNDAGDSGLLSLGHRFLSFVCSIQFSNLPQVLGLGFCSPSCTFSETKCKC